MLNWIMSFFNNDAPRPPPFAIRPRLLLRYNLQVSWAVAKHVRKNWSGLYSKMLCYAGDGELIKECIVIAFNEYCPDKVNLVKETCLSHQTIGSRIDDLGDNIEGTLKDKLSACVLYSLALDESTDQSDTAQLVIFIRGNDKNFNIIEEMLDLCQIKGTTAGKDIHEFVNLSLDKFNIDRKNIYSITTDGAPALTGKHNGFITLFKESVDHEFKAFLDEVGSVRWRSKAATLKRFQLLLPEIKVFLEEKKQNVDFLENEE